MSDSTSTHNATTPGAGANYAFPDAIADVASGTSLEDATARLIASLNQSDLLTLLDGDEDFWPGFRNLFYDRFNRVPYIFGQIPRLQLPGIRFTDGPRGVVMGSSTAFPVPMARGATWDTALEQRVGDVIGREAKAQGASFYSGVCINLPRHPAWGRCQEVYGEDPILLGGFGIALMQGVQRHIMACVKHFALNSMENARFQVDVEVDEDVLHEVYLPHFRAVVEAGVAGVMSSYNSVNGEWAGQNRELLTEILRRRWGFDGFVISDFIWGVRDPVRSVEAGLDVETPFRQLRHLRLRSALDAGELDWSAVVDCCSRVLRKQIEFASTLQADIPDHSVVYSTEHRALAREVASRSAVLLRNEPVDGTPLLPIDPRNIRKILLIGRLANTPITGDRGSSHVWSPHVVTPYEGAKAAFPDAEILLLDSGSPEEIAIAATGADLVLCVVGYTEKDEGEYAAPTLIRNPDLRALFPPAITDKEKSILEYLEHAGPREKDKSEDSWKAGAGGDRTSLRLRDADVELICAVAAVNPRTIVSVVCGGAVIMEEWQDKVPALLISWYAGCEGGHGLMDVLTGRVPASGRLPFSIPTSEAHLPAFDINATKVKYDRWFGQALLDKLGVEAAYPLGFGLSYTSFTTSSLRIREPGNALTTETVTVAAAVRNSGARVGRYVAQVYARANVPDFPSRVLLGFQAVDVGVGEEVEVSVSALLRPLQQMKDGHFVLRCHAFEVEFAAFAGDPDALRMHVVVK
ncbi:glycoside hydrolase superfamily [Aspergillus karnatakaensis]|uniref:glycoside hydrolase superfamily n=1 Tax=Aspergillus karnatakaensis TaxID=1810916 RepID=UPI003CCDCD8E